MRHFTIASVHLGETDLEITGGRFTSKIPVAAAKKAFSQLVQSKKITGAKPVVITVRESTQGSKHKEFKYTVSKIAQDKEITIGDKVIKYKFVVKAMAVKAPKIVDEQCVQECVKVCTKKAPAKKASKKATTEATA